MTEVANEMWQEAAEAFGGRGRWPTVWPRPTRRWTSCATA